MLRILERWIHTITVSRRAMAYSREQRHQGQRVAERRRQPR